MAEPATSRVNFNWGFRKLGAPYRELMDRDSPDVYDVFRKWSGSRLPDEARRGDRDALHGRPRATNRPRPARRRRTLPRVQPYLRDLIRVAERIYEAPQPRCPLTQRSDPPMLNVMLHELQVRTTG